MRIIFLDIDGVLNDEVTRRTYDPDSTWEDLRDDEVPSDTHLMQLKQIVDMTGAKIVLSSSWRESNWGLRTVLERLDAFGLTLLSITEDGVEEKALSSCKLDVEPRNVITRLWDESNTLIVHDRGAEIAVWLLRHEDVESFVILDDDDSDIAPYFPNNVITTDYITGLTDEDVKKAVEILNKNKD